MPLPSAILAQMRDTVTVTLAGEADAYGVVAAGATLLRRARVTYSRTAVATTRGDESVTGLTVYMEDVDGFTSDATLVLPDGKTYPVKSFTRPAWPDGSRHLRVQL
jgi:hypothetical protein